MKATETSCPGPARFHDGVFSPTFMRIVLTALVQEIQAQQLKIISRRE